MPSPYLDEARSLFEDLGFIVQAISFDRIVTDPALREWLANDYRDSQTAECLLNFPNLLLLHRTADPPDSTLLVNVIEEDQPVARPWVQGTGQLPLRIVCVRFRRVLAGKVEVTACFVGKPHEEKRLFWFLQRIMPLRLSRAPRQRIEGRGLVIA